MVSAWSLVGVILGKPPRAHMYVPFWLLCFEPFVFVYDRSLKLNCNAFPPFFLYSLKKLNWEVVVSPP